MLDYFTDKVGGFYSIYNTKGHILNAFVLSHTDIDISGFVNNLYDIDNGNIFYTGEYYCNCFVLVDEYERHFYLIEDDFNGLSYARYFIFEHSVLSEKKGQMIKLNDISDMVFSENNCLLTEFF